MDMKECVEHISEVLDEQRKTVDKKIEELKKDRSVVDLEEKLARQDAEIKRLTDEGKKFREQVDSDLLDVKRNAGASSFDSEAEQKAVQRAFFSTLHRTNGTHLTESEAKSLIASQMEASKVYGLRKTESEVKTMMSGIDTYGGLFVPIQTERNIMKLVQDDVALYRLSEKKTTGTSSYERPVRLAKAGVRWTGEAETRTKTSGNEYGNVKIDVHTVMACPEITSELMEDAYTDMESEIMDALRETFTEGYGEAFATGSGVKQPRGILSYPQAKQTSKAGVDWGKIGFTVTGTDGDFASAATGGAADCLIDMTVMLKSGYRQGAVWLMNSFSEAKIRKLKDKDGNYLWQPSLMAGVPNTLLGYPVEIDENMPDFGSGATPVAFGNFRKGYLVVERRGMRVIRDVTSKTPIIIFKVDARIGGGVQNFEAIKLLKASAS